MTFFSNFMERTPPHHRNMSFAILINIFNYFFHPKMSMQTIVSSSFSLGYETKDKLKLPSEGVREEKCIIFNEILSRVSVWDKYERHGTGWHRHIFPQSVVNRFHPPLTFFIYFISLVADRTQHFPHVIFSSTRENFLFLAMKTWFIFFMSPMVSFNCFLFSCNFRLKWQNITSSSPTTRDSDIFSHRSLNVGEKRRMHKISIYKKLKK